jgi:hypothetical protein
VKRFEKILVDKGREKVFSSNRQQNAGERLNLKKKQIMKTETFLKFYKHPHPTL